MSRRELGIRVVYNKKKKKKKNFGLHRRPERIKCTFVKHPRPCLAAMTLHLKLLRPLRDVDIISSLVVSEDENALDLY